MPELSIIILTYNSSKHIKACLESLFKFYIKELTDGKIELLVIDNNSTDDTREIVKEYIKAKNIYKLSTIHMFHNEKNVGFGSGLNVGVEKTKAPYILFINPDSELGNEKLLSMKDFLEKTPHAAVVGGRIEDNNEKVELSAGKFLTLSSFIKTNFGMERLGGGGIRFSPKKITEVDYVSGGFMMVERLKFEELGGFDKHIFMYMEDMELCFRMMKKGYNVYFYPEAVLKHIKHGSSSRAFAIQEIYRGTLYFFKKHKSRISYFLVKFLLMLKAWMLIVGGKVLRRPELVSTYEKALNVC